MRDDWPAQLSQVEVALLERLCGGVTLAAAAAAEYLSLRTANRRLAALRERAGLPTTRALVASYRAAKGASSS